jgi:hypothetical protein
VRFDSDDFQGQVEESAIPSTGPMVSWSSIGLVEIRL